MRTIEPNPGPVGPPSTPPTSPRPLPYTFTIQPHTCPHELAITVHEAIRLHRYRWVTFAYDRRRGAFAIVSHTGPDLTSPGDTVARFPCSREVAARAHIILRRMYDAWRRDLLAEGIEPNPGPPCLLCRYAAWRANSRPHCIGAAIGLTRHSVLLICSCQGHPPLEFCPPCWRALLSRDAFRFTLRDLHPYKRDLTREGVEPNPGPPCPHGASCEHDDHWVPRRRKGEQGNAAEKPRTAAQAAYQKRELDRLKAAPAEHPTNFEHHQCPRLDCEECECRPPAEHHHIKGGKTWVARPKKGDELAAVRAQVEDPAPAPTEPDKTPIVVVPASQPERPEEADARPRTIAAATAQKRKSTPSRRRKADAVLPRAQPDRQRRSPPTPLTLTTVPRTDGGEEVKLALEIPDPGLTPNRMQLWYREHLFRHFEGHTPEPARAVMLATDMFDRPTLLEALNDPQMLHVIVAEVIQAMPKPPKEESSSSSSLSAPESGGPSAAVAILERGQSIDAPRWWYLLPKSQDSPSAKNLTTLPASKPAPAELPPRMMIRESN